MWWWALASGFAAIEGDVSGSPFTAPHAIAVADPAHPGQLGVIITDEPVACGARPPDSATALMIHVEAIAGAQAEPAAVLAAKAKKRFAFGTSDATLVTLPGQVGAQGALRVDRAHADGQFDLHGTVAFTLCDLVSPAPAPTTTWTRRTISVGDGGAKVTLPVPVDWASKQDTFGNPSYVGQDGRTTLTVSTTCGGSCEAAALPANLAAWGPNQYGAFQGVSGWTTTVHRDEARTSSTRVVRYDLDNGMGPSPWLHVVRWEPGWTELVVCKATAPVKHQAIFDAITEACATATLVARP